jgi:hypothetical protein
MTSFELNITWDDNQVSPSGETKVFSNLENLLLSAQEHGFLVFVIEEDHLVSRHNGNRAVIQSL